MTMLLMVEVVTLLRVMLLMVLAMTVAAIGVRSRRGRQAMRLRRLWRPMVARGMRRMWKSPFSSSTAVAVVMMPLLVRFHNRPWLGGRSSERQRPLHLHRS